MTGFKLNWNILFPSRQQRQYKAYWFHTAERLPVFLFIHYFLLTKRIVGFQRNVCTQTQELCVHVRKCKTESDWTPIGNEGESTRFILVAHDRTKQTIRIKSRVN